MKIFPWDNGVKAYWVNPENGLEWYVDKDMSKWCVRDMTNNAPKLEAVCFYVVEVDGDNRRCLSRVLVDKKSNEPIHNDTTMEGMATKIDMFRAVLLFKDK